MKCLDIQQQNDKKTRMSSLEKRFAEAERSLPVEQLQIMLLEAREALITADEPIVVNEA